MSGIPRGALRVLVLADLSAIHSIRWIEALEEEFKVEAVSLESPALMREGYTVLSSPLSSARWKYLLSVPKVHRVASRFKPHVLNPHFVPNYGLIARLVPGSYVRVLCTWGSDLLCVPEKSAFHRLATGWIVRGMDMVVVDADNLRRVVEGYGYPSARILQVPYGVPRKLVDMPLQPISSFPPEKWKLVTHRRLVKEMDPITVIRAASLLARKGVRFELHMASDGPLSPVVKEMVASLGLRTHVFLRGKLGDEELYDLIGNSHIYISASLTDSTSVSLLEAMALGAFPIVSDLPANREWITHGENGLLFCPGSPEDLCAKVESAISLLDLLLSSRERNKRLIRDRADWEKNMALVRSCLQYLVAKGKPATLERG